MTKMLYQGHGSYRLTANDGRVFYADIDNAIKFGNDIIKSIEATVV